MPLGSMLLSRFWYLVIATTAAVALGAAFLAQGTTNRLYANALSDSLRRDRFEVEATLKLDARSRIDALAPIAAHADVRSALKRASFRDIDRKTRRRLDARLSELNRQLSGMAGDVVFALDNKGHVVGQAGSKEVPQGASLETMPLVAKALSGYLRDDVWIMDGQILRMAARPVVDGGQYIGAIVHGSKMDDDLARVLSERLGGVTVAFFLDDRIVSAHVPAELATTVDKEVVGGALKTNAGEQKKAAKPGAPEPLDLGSAMAVLSPVTGQAAYVGAGYVLARPKRHIATPMALFDEATSDDVSNLPWFLLIVLPLVLFAAALGLLWLEHDRPFRRFAGSVERIAQAGHDRLNPAEHPGALRSLAQAVNHALDAASPNQSSRSMKGTNLDEILGPTPGSTEPPPFFGFAGGQSAASSEEDDVPSVPPAAPRSGISAAHSGISTISSVARAGNGGSGINGPQGARGKNLPPPPPVPARQPSTTMELELGGSDRPSELPGEATTASAGPPASMTTSAINSSERLSQPPLRPSQPPERLSQPPLTVEQTDHELMMDDPYGATVVTQLPEYAGDGADEGPPPADESPEERHFRQVFKAFLTTNQQCGVPVQGLTYDKFAVTLRKTRDQIVAKKGVRRVRFTVYVKEGKAALKATPIRD
jgi:hypothetical protein